jgi:hypothetical protein
MFVSTKKRPEEMMLGGPDGVERMIKTKVSEMRDEKRGNSLLPAKPTNALPGSSTKILVLAQRYATRQQLWHTLDQRRCNGRQRRMNENMVSVF